MAKKAGPKDYWALLGLAAGATDKEIQTAYRKKSLAVHPDRYKGDDPEGAKQQFLDLTEAKETLCDPKARAAWENARAKVELAAQARAKHDAQKAAQTADRRRMREDLEEREEAAKRARGPTEEQLRAARMKEEEDDAMAELKRELDRLRRTGRLDGTQPAAATSTPAAAPAPAASASSSDPTAKASGRLSVRWGADKQFEKAELLALLVEFGAPANLELAVVGSRAVAEFSSPADARKLLDRAFELSARGVRVAQSGGAVTAAAATGTAAAGGGPLPEGWREVATAEGKVYYYNVHSRLTQWTRPTGSAGAAGAACAVASARDLAANENLTLMRLRQASERQRLMKEMEQEDAAS